ITGRVAHVDLTHSQLETSVRASQRYSGKLRELRLIVHGAEIDRNCYRARPYAEHQDVVARELDAGGAREHAHAAFGQGNRRCCRASASHSCTEVMLMMRPPSSCFDH